MSALDSAEQWQAAADALADWRANRSPETFPHALGVDAEALMEFCTADAVDTMKTVMGLDPDGPDHQRLEAPLIGASLAAHTQIGVELGLWLTTTPEGRAFMESQE